MVRGLERFREYFRDFSDSYVLIGGVACEILFNSIRSDFRLTDDFDLVVIVDSSREDLEKD